MRNQGRHKLMQMQFRHWQQLLQQHYSKRPLQPHTVTCNMAHPGIHSQQKQQIQQAQSIQLSGRGLLQNPNTTQKHNWTPA
jgi:hypothetical protein